MPGLIVVRHAQSTWNGEGRWQGQADPPLSERGEQDARQAAGRLASLAPGVDLVVSSDLIRARRTAELLVDGGGPVLEPLLREYDVGAWSGLTRDQIEERWPGELKRFDAGRTWSPPGGEDRRAFDGRVRRAAASVAALAADAGAEHVLVVAHGGVIRALARLADLVERPVPFLSGYIGEVDAPSLRLSDRVDLLDVGGPRDRPTPQVPSSL